jgi:hypothetical protein
MSEVDSGQSVMGGVQVRQIGEGAHAMIVVDRFSGQPERIRAIAAAMAPFERSEDTYYPGLRRHFTRDDLAACAYADKVLERVVPLIGQVFGARRLECLDASFSIVATPPDALKAGQRVPHFDSVDPGYFAVLHYLSTTAGTAFYRQRATGIEQVTQANRAACIAAAEVAMTQARGYFSDEGFGYDQVGEVEGLLDRLVIYRGSLLHGSIIPPDFACDPDPRTGRLTANLFVRATG